MKGQYRIIMEVMLFAIGVAITSFILVSFQDLQSNTQTVSIRDQLDVVHNSVLTGIVKASLADNAIVRVDIPTSVSDEVYMFYIENGENLSVSPLSNRSLKLSRQIFNIDKPNRVISGEVVSGAGAVKISADSTAITLRRG